MRGFGVESSDSEIYERNKHDLIRYASALVGPDRAETVVSNALVRTLGRRSLTDLDDPRVFLFQQLLRESKANYRKGRFFSDMGQLARWEEQVLPPEVWGAVEKLPIEHRAATFLFFWVELSVGETAKLMGRRPATVKRYLRLARLRLQEVLDGPAV